MGHSDDVTVTCGLKGDKAGGGRGREGISIVPLKEIKYEQVNMVGKWTR